MRTLPRALYTLVLSLLLAVPLYAYVNPPLWELLYIGVVIPIVWLSRERILPRHSS